MEKKKIKKDLVNTILIYLALIVLTMIFIFPLIIVLYNSFKSKLYILKYPFELPNSNSWVGFDNYIDGMKRTKFIIPFLYSMLITIGSVFGIVLFTSMTAWFIARVKNTFTKIMYYMFVFSMIVPFQMVMFSLVKISDLLYLNNPLGIMFIYLGFGAGLSVFIFVGFIKSIPIEIEEASTIDGCNPIQTFFLVVMPILKSTIITVGILNVMWIWNDYLLPYLIFIGTNYITIPIAIQGAMKGLYGSTNWGSFMAMLVVAIVPIIIFYATCQKHIIKGVTDGAIKG